MSRPNVIFINTDQQSAFAMSVYSDEFKTPNLDKLRSRSFCFGRACGTVTPEHKQ